MRIVTRSLASVIAAAVPLGCESWKVDPDPEPIPKAQEWMYRPVGKGVPGVDPAVPYEDTSRDRRNAGSRG